MKKREKRSKSSDTKEEDKPHRISCLIVSSNDERADHETDGQGGGPLDFPQHDSIFPPQQFHNAPNQAPTSAYSGFHSEGHAQPQPQLHNMPRITNARFLQRGEMNSHLQRGGQTEYGERPRGQGQSVYIDDERTVPGGGRGEVAPSRQPSTLGCWKRSIMSRGEQERDDVDDVGRDEVWIEGEGTGRRDECLLSRPHRLSL
jgi:hypothetical protein